MVTDAELTRQALEVYFARRTPDEQQRLLDNINWVVDHDPRGRIVKARVNAMQMGLGWIELAVQAGATLGSAAIQSGVQLYNAKQDRKAADKQQSAQIAADALIHQNELEALKLQLASGNSPGMLASLPPGTVTLLPWAIGGIAVVGLGMFFFMRSRK